MTFGSLRRLAGRLLVLAAFICTSKTFAQSDAERATGLYSRYDAPAMFINAARAETAPLAPLSGISSDDFSSGTLNPAIWSFINPGTPSTLSFTGAGTSNARLSISVPAGSAHDAWTGGNNTPRIMQAAPNTDFEVEVKFESPLTSRYQIEGVIVEQDANNYLRFDFNSNGTNTKVFAASISAGTATSRNNATITAGNPLYLRVRRIGNQWTQSYSYNGTTWITAVTFSHTLTVTAVGPFVGNAGSPAPAFTGLVDYFFNAASPIVPEDAVISWWSATRRFRLPVEIKANGYQRINKPAEVEVNFTQLLNALGQASPFSENSLRVIEVSNTGAILDTTVRFQFDKEPGYNASSNARGTVSLLMGGTTAPNASRYFHVYFETLAGGSFTLPSMSSQVTVTDNVMDEGQPSIKVVTPKGTYYYHKMGGGFSSIEDTQGNDWVNYHPGGGTSGEFRGIPNIGDVFHPGYTNSISTVESQGPVKSRIRSVSVDGQWECVWDIFPEYARMRLLRKAGNYWFLFEGTPGGVFNPTTDFMYRSNGQRMLLSGSIASDLAAPEWAYFGDRNMRRSFFVAHHEDDFQQDYYRSDTNMTIFGFGRQDPCCTKLLTTVPQNFTVGFADDSTFSSTSQVVNAAYQEMQALQSAPQSHPATMLPPGIVSNPSSQSVFVGEAATFNVGATGTAPLSYQWQKNGSNIAGGTSASYTTPAASLVDSGAIFHCVVTNSLGSATSLAATLTVSPAPGAPISDDFNGYSLNTNLWTATNPLGDATFAMTGTGTSNARLTISIPSGISHDNWSSGLMSPRIMQNISNTDFEVQTKFEGGMTQQYQAEGFLVMQDNGNLLRFDITRDLTKNRVFCASFVNGVPTVRKDTTIALSVFFHLKLKRVGNQWTFSYSFNGTNWFVGATFNHVITAKSVGLFVANAGTNPPFFFGQVDYFFNTASPIVPEDGGIPGDPGAPVVSNVQAIPNQGGFNVTWTTNEPATGVVQFGQTTLYELGSASQSGRTFSHVVPVTGLQPSTFYNFRILSADSSNNQTTTGNFTVTTAPVTVPTINVWYGKNQNFGQIGNPVPDINILGNAFDPDGLISLTATLNGGLPRNITLGPDTRRVSKKGDFNIDFPYATLLNGPNQLIITATDSLSTAVRETVTVNYSFGNTWPKTYTANWGGAGSISNVAQIVDGLWAIESGELKIVEPGYDRLVAIGEQTWNNYEVTVPFTVSGIDSAGFQPPSNGASVGMILRWPGHSDNPELLAGRQPKTGFLPLGAFGSYNWGTDGEKFNLLGNNLSLLDEDSTGRTISLNTLYNLKMRVETNTGIGALYRMKLWQNSLPEPMDWDLVGQEEQADPQNGTFLLVAHHVYATFGDINIVQLGDTTHSLITSTVGSGTITRDPNGLTYPAGQVVTLTAVPASGWQFDHWTGDLTGGTNPETISMGVDRVVTAHFIPETVPPQISNIRSSATSTHATIWWTTDEGSSSIVQFGSSAAYENGNVTNNALVTQHMVVLSNLVPGATYHFKVTSIDGNNNSSSSGDTTFTLSLPSTLVSDDFNRFGLNQALWTSVNPLGDGVVASSGTNTPNASINITVPAGVIHDIWSTGIQTPRIMQATNNADFEIEAKFFSGMSQRFQLQGVVVQQDSNDFLRLELNSDGSSTRMLAASIENGLANLRANVMVAPNNTTPMFLRVKREGDLWTLTYSLDGQTWLPGTSFIHPLVVSSMGLFAGNLGVPVPSHTATIDYFFNTASPIAAEDSGLASDITAPAITSVHVTTDTTQTTITWITDEPATSHVAYGLTDGYEFGSIGDTTLVTDHSVTLTGLSPNMLHHYRITSGDAVGNLTTMADSTFIAQNLASILVSDDFNSATLNTSVWNFINPANDATLSMVGTGTNDAWLSIAVPGGTSHDVWTSGVFAPRVMQPANNTDFEVEAKYESGVIQRFQLQGILIQQDNNDFLRIEFNSDGTATKLFVASLVDSVPTTRTNITVGANGVLPMYLRILRVGNAWKVSYSSNGTSWTTGVIFTHPMTVSAVGPYFGNSGSPVPAFTGSLDYFFNSASPRLPEDGGTPVPPSIITQPVNKIVALGARATFTISATGNPMPTFQWQKNGTDIPGATDSLYQTPVTTLGDSGAIYRCRISNVAGNLFSNSAILSVQTPPAVTTPHYTLTVGLGQQATFIVEATGTQPLSYQWLKNETEISGATSATYLTPPATIADSNAEFRCRVSNLVGTVNGPINHLIVHTPAGITTQPVDTTVATGQTARFTVAATGVTPITYQWFKNDVEVQGGVFTTFTVSSALKSDSGATFKCRVTNPGGIVFSNTARLRVLDSPAIVTQPAHDSLLAGTVASFSIVASGAVPLSYQWQRNGVNINGATAATYNTSTVTLADSGSWFRCIVSNAVGTVTSNPAYLIVMVAPTITGQPQNKIVSPGQTASFLVSFKGSFPFRFQWQRNGVDIPGATLLGYTTGPTTAADSGATFRCKVGNAVGEVWSNSALLEVAQPATIVQHPANQNAAVGQTATFTVVATGTPTLTYQWQRNSVNISGATSASYTTPLTAKSDSGATYRCKVTNIVRQVTSNSAILNVGTAPSITVQPMAQSISVGGTATFSITTTGSNPRSYQWKKNGVVISGATLASYTTPAATLTDNGSSFRCVVTNTYGTATSDSARLTVTGATRVVTNLQALYTFNEGSGTTVQDVSGVGTPLNLTIASAGAVTWGTGKLTINSSTTILSPSSATKVINAAMSTNQITMEAWVQPANTTQTGPAHIVGLPSSSTSRNVVLGQSASRYEGRVRTSSTGTSGTGLTSPLSSATTALSHVVYTRDAAGAVKMYINGTQVSSGTVSGTFSNWNTSTRLGIGNETGGARPWLGELHLVAIYNRALTQTEVTQNFNAGANPASVAIAKAGIGTPSDDLPKEFRLHQNYPNPFNPLTTIRFELPRDGNVTIKLFNIVGQEVLTLVDEPRAAGVYEVQLDAKDLASGAYIYRLHAGEFVSTKKLMLLK